MTAEGPPEDLSSVPSNAVDPGSKSPSPSSKLLAWLPAFLYTSLIWWLSSQAVAIEAIERFPFQDKGVHFVEYAGLGLTLCFAVHRTWPGRGLRAGLAAVLMTSSLGLLDELHQAFVPERSADVLDLVADTCGAFFAALLYEATRRFRLRRAQSAAPLDAQSNAS